MPKTIVTADFHCVTTWSRLDNVWEGIAFNEVIKKINPFSEAKFAMLHCSDGYTTNLALDQLINDDVLFAYKHDGKSLDHDHGYPLRLVVPKRYAWKSAKWVCGLEFLAEDQPGFWEERGYHMDGDPWKEERFDRN